MKVNVSATVLDIHGNAVKDKGASGDVDVTVKDVLILALSRGEDPRENISAPDLVKRKKLAQSIVSSDSEVEMKSEEVSLLKKLVANLPKNVGFNPLVAGIVIEMVEPETKA